MTRPTDPHWYIQQNDVSRGPFTREQIRRDLVLGRLGLDALVSQDQQHWTELGTLPELVPDVLSQSGSPEGDRALMLARLREDERHSGNEMETGFGDRRREEAMLSHLHRRIRDSVQSRRMMLMSWLTYALAVLVIVVVALVGAYLYS